MPKRLLKVSLSFIGTSNLHLKSGLDGVGLKELLSMFFRDKLEDLRSVLTPPLTSQRFVFYNGDQLRYITTIAERLDQMRLTAEF